MKEKLQEREREKGGNKMIRSNREVGITISLVEKERKNCRNSEKGRKNNGERREVKMDSGKIVNERIVGKEKGFQKEKWDTL